MRRSELRTLIVFVIVVIGSVVGVIAAGWSPLLGLDLQGGVAVVLRPTTPADNDQIDQAITIIRSRVDAIGVAEPDITRQGGNIVVQLPGVKDQQRALDLVGTTAELRFRPVLQEVPTQAMLDAFNATSTRVAPGSETTTTAPGETTTSTAPGTSETTATTAPTTTAATSTSSEQGLAVEDGSGGEGTAGVANGEVALGRQSDAAATTTTAPPTTTAPAGETTTTAAPDGATTTASTAPETTSTTAPLDPNVAPPITSREDDKVEATVILPEFDPPTSGTVEVRRHQLGPALVTGDALAEARAALNPNDGTWYVALKFKDGEENVGRWRAAAAACFNRTATCPTGRLAIALDGRVLSTPQVQTDFRDTNEATITGQFKERDVRNLATALKYGALPVEFERQQSQEVSPTIGRDALTAGVVSGIIGLVLISLYLLAYYRVLGVVAVLSLLLSFGLLWALICWLGETQGLALTLAGVTGIIVSIGVSVDSNIVYFEQIKDDMATGRNLRSSAERAFRGAMSTIVKADLVSLIGAMLLYFLTVGPVRGFALFLGLSTVLDLIASYFFMRPAVVWLSRTRLATERPKTFGIPEPRALAAPQVAR